MDKYKEGTIFSLYEDSDEDYLVLKRSEIDGNIYILVTPVKINEDNLKYNEEKLILLSVDEKTEEIAFETDVDIITKVVDDLLININKE